MAYFPFMIQMDNRSCLIAGGGRVALRKVEMMLQFGARVKVVAPDIDEQIYRLSETNEKLSLCRRKVELKDLDNVYVVIMATNDSAVNSKYAEICKERRILVNVVDVKGDCGFYFPAIIKQGDVVMSVSTGGNSPVLASGIKKEIKANIREDYGRIAKELGDMRENVINSYEDELERKKIFEKLLEKKMNDKVIRIGTRGSALALIQTDMVIDAIKKVYPDYRCEKIILTTKGDRQKDKPIMAFGGKAVFVEEFENALLDYSIDIAVHSAKDMPNPCKDGLCIAGVLPRGCANDVLIYKKGFNPDRKNDFIIGTSSLRRQYQIKEIYPNSQCRDLRGNIGTRINKLKEGQYDAIILAAAGIERQGLNKDDELTYEYLPTDKMLPAAGQAIIAIEARKQSRIGKLISDISDTDTEIRLRAERTVLTNLNAGCHEPVGVWSRTEAGIMEIDLMIVRDDRIIRKSISGKKDEWRELADRLSFMEI